MKVLTGSKISHAIKACAPVRVAVAYVGSDWKSFLPAPEKLDFIILSPTVGSDPNAISQIARRIGWDKVLFLDQLHAKVYLGRSTALVGSANLTKNGLSGQDLHELCIGIQSPQSLPPLCQAMEDWRNEAQRSYPSLKDKRAQLRRLKEAWKAGIVNKVLVERRKKAPRFEDFDYATQNQLYVLWYQRIKVKYSSEVRAIENLIADDLMRQRSLTGFIFMMYTLEV